MKKIVPDIKYLPVNEIDSNWGMTVTTVGFQQIEPLTVYPPSIHPSEYYFDPKNGRILHEYQLVYVTQGEGKFCSESVKPTKIRAGNIFMLFPGEWHSYEPDRNMGWSEYWIGFNGSYIKQLVQMNFFGKHDPIFNIGHHDRIVELFVRIIEEAKYEKIGFQQLISGATIYILGQLYSIHRNNEFSNKEIENLINHARVVIRENLHTDLSPESLAASLNIGYSWFRRMFKQYTGLAPAQYILQLKIQKARELLADPNLPIKEIAFKLNFYSHYHFSNLFRKKTGFSPSEFRNMSIGEASSGSFHFESR